MSCIFNIYLIVYFLANFCSPYSMETWYGVLFSMEHLKFHQEFKLQEINPYPIKTPHESVQKPGHKHRHRVVHQYSATGSKD